MNNQIKNYLVIFTWVLLFSLNCFAQNEKQANLTEDYNEETDKTTVILKNIKLPKDKNDFNIGAVFEFTGRKLEKEPCCSAIFFTAISRKQFQFEENHKLTVWADNEKFEFNDVHWRESAMGTAFIIAQLAYPEEMIAGMKTDEFRKIANAKKVKMMLGNFKFSLTSEHLSGFRQLLEKMKVK